MLKYLQRYVIIISIIIRNSRGCVVMSLKEKAKQLKTDVPAVFLALKDKKTPRYARLVAALIAVLIVTAII